MCTWTQTVSEVNNFLGSDWRCFNNRLSLKVNRRVLNAAILQKVDLAVCHI